MNVSNFVYVAINKISFRILTEFPFGIKFKLLIGFHQIKLFTRLISALGPTNS